MPEGSWIPMYDDCAGTQLSLGEVTTGLYGDGGRCPAFIAATLVFAARGA